MTLPLSSVLVLDLGDEPMVLGARLLADLGADVVRIESRHGDPVRQRPPFVHGSEGLERSLAHLRYNAGKRSLALDFEHPRAMEVVDALAAPADIAFAPMEHSELTAAFFAEAHLRQAAPRLGVVEAVLRRNRPGGPVSDLVGVAAGGMLYLNGYPEDPPNHPAGQLAYKQTSLAAAMGAMALLLENLDNPVGGRVTVSMQEAMMWTTIQSANENYWYWHEQRPRRRGLANLGGQTIFATKDEQWVSFYQHPPAWRIFAAWVEEVLGEGRFLEPEWGDDHYRHRNNDEVVAVTERLCGAMSREKLIAEAQRRAILVVPVQGVMDIVNDPHLRARDFFQMVWHEPLGMELEVLRPAFLSSTYRASAAAAPGLGQHTRDVLATIGGFGEDEIEQLVADGVVGAASEVVR